MQKVKIANWVAKSVTSQAKSSEAKEVEGLVKAEQ